MQVIQQEGFLDTEFSLEEILAPKKSGLHILLWTGLQYPLQTESKSTPLHSKAIPPIYWEKESAEDGNEK